LRLGLLVIAGTPPWCSAWGSITYEAVQFRPATSTLYVLTPKSYLALEGETVAIRQQHATRRIPLHTLDGIVAFGNVACSPALMFACAERDVTLSFLAMSGRFQARVQGPVSGNVLLRREQYRRADDLEGSAEIARSMVTAKIANSRQALLRCARDHPECPGQPRLAASASGLATSLRRMGADLTLEEVRGVEGEAAGTYFGSFDHLIVSQKDEFCFKRRSRRPPLDRVNALLSFLYGVLAHDAASALEGVGLDPAVGFLHRDRPGRPGLALDLMEEMRPVLADRMALSLINRRQVHAAGFEVTETGAVLMDDDTRKTVLSAYQKRKREEIEHPFLKERVPLGLLPHVQAMMLARHLRGDLDAYPAFFWR
jgi:CRISPR-associated protein Cas1